MIRRIAASLLPVVFAFAGCTARAQGDPPQANSVGTGQVADSGRNFTSPTSLARSSVTGIHAPQQAFIPIAGAGHFAVFMKSREFLGQLVSHVRPLATH